MKVNVLDIQAKKVGEIELNEGVFGVEYNEPLIHQVVVAQLANRRQGTKSTLTRTEVRGGGKKPWRQKGTGRARQGSIRSPQWTGGGVVFAPKPRDFSQKINKKMKVAATLSALSAKVSDNDFLVLDKLQLEEAKTKYIAQMLKAFEINSSVLLVIDNNDEAIKRASANIGNLTLVNADLVSVYDLAANTKCIFTVDAVNMIQKRFEEVCE